METANKKKTLYHLCQSYFSQNIPHQKILIWNNNFLKERSIKLKNTSLKKLSCFDTIIDFDLTKLLQNIAPFSTAVKFYILQYSISMYHLKNILI